MKRILIINNYSMKLSMKWAEDGSFPAHHCWGCDELRKNARLRFMTFTLPSLAHKLHIAHIWYYIQNIWILLLSIGCDTIYVAASPLVDLLGFLKYVGLFRKKIVMVIHHPHNFSLKHQRYDKLIFICEKAYSLALLDYPQFKDRFIMQEWGPDLSFYGSLRATMDEKSFISNGITSRDNETLIEVSKLMDKKVGILCNQQSIPTNYAENLSNVKLIFNKGTMINGKIMSYKEMTQFTAQYSVCVIPTRKKQTSLCGLTSFCDAIALGMPVVLADTTHIDINFTKYPFGYYYEAENIENLKLYMERISYDTETLERMSAISRHYAEDHDYGKFAKTICRAVLE